MRRFLKRLAMIPLTMLIVSAVVFICLSCASGDSSAYILPEDASPEAAAAYRASMGLDEPLLMRYSDFLFSFIAGNWGLSAGGRDIMEMIGTRLPVTLSVSALALLISLCIAVPAAYLSVRRKSAADAISTGAAIAVSSMPVFLIAMLLVLLFAVLLGWFPVAGYVPLSGGLLPHLGSIFLPSLALALLHSSLLMLLFRRSLRENLSEPYARAAAAAGLSRRLILFKSATRPALPILVMVTGESAAAFLGGSAAVETVFALPGLGSLMVAAALGRDTALSSVIVMLSALMVSLVSLAAETAADLIDPRRRRKA